MTRPRLATDGPGGRFYAWRSERYWSVTKIIGGGVPKPALLPWGIKSVAEGAVSQRNVLVAMLENCETPAACAGGDYCARCTETIRWLKGLPYAARDRAADLGTSLHEACEAYALGKPFPKWAPLVKPRMRQFERFLARYEPKFLLTEASVFNRTERYAGTLDAIVEIGGRTLLLDMKSGKAVYPETALQLAAYRHAEFIGMPDGSERPMTPTDGGVALHLTDQEAELLDVECGEDVFRAFKYAREVFRWVEQTSKGVIRGPVPVPGDTTEAVEAVELSKAVNA